MPRVRKRLDILLVERGLAESRNQAQALVLAGLVPGFDKPGQQVEEDVEVTVRQLPRFVSRGGEKLAHALDAFNVPVRGIGNTTVERIAELEEEAGSFYAACQLALERGWLKSAATEKVKQFAGMIEMFRGMVSSVPFPELAARVVEQTGYGPMLRDEQSEEANDRLQNVEELLKGMQEFASTAHSLRVGEAAAPLRALRAAVKPLGNAGMSGRQHNMMAAKIR